MVATDSYRLSVKETQLEAPLDGRLRGQRAGARAAGARAASSQAGERGRAVASACAPNQVVFEVGGVVLSSRLIDGQFPNYRQLLPDTYEHELRLAGGEVTDVVRRIALLAQKNAPLRLAFREGELTVSAQTPDIGEAREALPVPFAGEPLEIGFNPDFLRDGLESVERRRRRAQADLAAAPRAASRPADGSGLPVPASCRSGSTCRGAVRVDPPRRARLPLLRGRRGARSGPALTVVPGRNGAGKTNLLEALYFGCTGRSCRTTNEREVVRFGATVARRGGRTRATRAARARADASASSPARPSACASTARRSSGWRTRRARPLVSRVPARPAGARRRAPPALRRAHLDQVVAALWPARAAHAPGLRRGARPAQRAAGAGSAPAGRRAARSPPGTPSSPATASR